MCSTLLLSIFISLFPLPSHSAEIPEKSRERTNKIIKIIKRFQGEYDNLNDPAVKKTLMEEIAEFVTLSPDSEIKTVSKDDLVNQIRRKVALRFPDKHTEFIKKVNVEAEEKFKMTKINEFISVKYKKGNTIFTQEGVFYGYGIGSKSVKIGNSNISIIDLFDSDRIKFDEPFNKQQLKEFINSRIENYYKVKQAYFTEVHTNISKQLNDENESNGYIYVWNKWWTAKELTQKLIDDEMSGSKPAPTEDVTEGETTKPPVNVPTEEVAEVPTTETSKNQKGKNLIKKAEDEWVRISNTFPGIDGDQGYNPALWYMKSNDVDILLAKELAGKQEGDTKVIKMPSGPIECIELHFFHGYFYKVVTRYRIAKTVEAMVHVAQKIKDKYGPTDQEKEAELVPAEGEGNTENPEVKPEEAKKSDEAKKPEEAKKSDEAKKPEKKEEPPVEEPPPPPPPEETFTWTGKITKGTLYFKRNPDSSLAEMTFTKENPKVIEEISIKLEEERKKKEKEDKQKELELYKKFKN